MNECSIAVIGATGAVGQVFLSILEERDLPLKSLRLCASERSVGKKIVVRWRRSTRSRWRPRQLLSKVDFAFISASSAVSREMAPACRRGRRSRHRRQLSVQDGAARSAGGA